MIEKLSDQENKTFSHKTVFLDQAVQFLNPKDGRASKIFVDATLGGGGHTRAILESDPTCKVIAIDWDRKAVENAEINLKPVFGDRLELAFSNFTGIKLILKKLGISVVDGILADFGTSQEQIISKDGFSFSKDTPLDMRMSNSHKHITAEAIVNQASQEELELIFSRFGQERFSRPIARKIVEQREKNPLKTTAQLAELVLKIVAAKSNPKTKWKIHPATKVFQALRIAVNGELDNIDQFLRQAYQALKPGGIFVCISFHSLEDVLVKNFFKDRVFENQDSKILTNKAVSPTEDQIAANPSCRSAKMRVFQK